MGPYPMAQWLQQDPSLGPLVSVFEGNLLPHRIGLPRTCTWQRMLPTCSALHRLPSIWSPVSGNTVAYPPALEGLYLEVGSKTLNQVRVRQF
jgi:hypothetical protein